FERDACELTHQIGFLNRQAGAAQDCESIVTVCRLNPLDLRGHAVNRVNVGDRAKAAFGCRIALESGCQAIRMRALQITLHTFRAEHSPVERKVFPRLESDHLIVLDLKLNAALLPAETAVRLDNLVGFDTCLQPHPSIENQVWTKAFSDVI